LIKQDLVINLKIDLEKQHVADDQEQPMPIQGNDENQQ
jgi:hypothetical protein